MDELPGVGCALCNGDDAMAVSTWCLDQGGLAIQAFLVDESHLVVALRRCRMCSQPFVSVMTEVVDWAGGNDAQDREVVPVTEAEAVVLTDPRGRPDLDYIGSLGEGRRRLSVSWPTGAEKWTGWSLGGFTIQPGH